MSTLKWVSIRRREKRMYIIVNLRASTVGDVLINPLVS